MELFLGHLMTEARCAVELFVHHLGVAVLPARRRLGKTTSGATTEVRFEGDF